VVLDLLRGADPEWLSRSYAVAAATLPACRDAFLAAGEAGIKVRQEDLLDRQCRRMKSAIAGMAIENERLQLQSPKQAGQRLLALELPRDDNSKTVEEIAGRTELRTAHPCRVGNFQPALRTCTEKSF